MKKFLMTVVLLLFPILVVADDMMWTVDRFPDSDGREALLVSTHTYSYHGVPFGLGFGCIVGKSINVFIGSTYSHGLMFGTYTPVRHKIGDTSAVNTAWQAVNQFMIAYRHPEDFVARMLREDPKQVVFQLATFDLVFDTANFTKGFAHVFVNCDVKSTEHYGMPTSNPHP